jgi:hypothetical protein
MALRVDTPPWPPYFTDMLSRSAPPSGFIEPCPPSPADRPPAGSDWVHEIKHDGYRLMARRMRLSGLARKDTSARPLQIKEPGLVRRVLPGEPDCELEVHETAVDRMDIVIVEEEPSLVRRHIIDVSQLLGSGEAAVGVIFADEGVTVINDPGGIEVIYFDAVTLRIVEVQDQVCVREVDGPCPREVTSAVVLAEEVRLQPDERVCIGSAEQGVAIWAVSKCVVAATAV